MKYVSEFLFVPLPYSDIYLIEFFLKDKHFRALEVAHSIPLAFNFGDEVWVSEP